MDGETKSIAVIGAGMAGLSCAQELVEAGHRVQIFDKGRGPGGRMSTRRAEFYGQTLRFDHGAQYFTARDPSFRKQVELWDDAGVVARWPAAGDDAWVGIPAMNAPIRAMADALGVVWAQRIERLVRDGARWMLHCEGRTFAFDGVICAVPAEQAADLLGEVAPALATVADDVDSEPCWAVMVAFEERFKLPDCIRAADSPISWAARDSSKPGRSEGENWVLHASPTRTKELLDHPREEVATILLGDFFAQTGIAPEEPSHLTAHRWLYAMPKSRDGEPAEWHPDLHLGICGDYLHSPRVEGAFLSGRALAAQILERP